jgi:hypothetical protein
MSSPDIQIAMIGGQCPVQAEGTIDGKPFYFRARGQHWELRIGDDPMAATAWSHRQAYGNEPYAAGWMTEDEARKFIVEAAKSFHTD